MRAMRITMGLGMPVCCAVLGAVLGGVLAVCGPARAAEVREPGDAAARADEQIPGTAHFDVSYGPHERHVYDIYLPTDMDGPYPVAVYIHGGGFRQGDKSILTRDSTKNLRYMLDLGIAVASINYRYSTQAPYPAPMLDAARAIQTLRYRADEYNLDRERFVAWGGSAGGGISLWLALHDDLADPDSDDPVARESTRLVGAAGGAAQTTYDPFVVNEIFPGVRADQTEMWRTFYGKPLTKQGAEEMQDPALRAVFADASPATHVSADDPPIYLSYSSDGEVTADTPAGTWVHHADLGRYMVEKLQAAGVGYVLQVSGQPRESGGDAPEHGGMNDFLAKMLGK